MKRPTQPQIKKKKKQKQTYKMINLKIKLVRVMNERDMETHINCLQS